MNRTQLKKALAARTGLTHAEADDVLDALFGVAPVAVTHGEGLFASALTAGEKVTIPGFGTFATRETKARAAKNPKTGAPMNVPAGVRVGFSPGKALRERQGRRAA